MTEMTYYYLLCIFTVNLIVQYSPKNNKYAYIAASPPPLLKIINVRCFIYTAKRDMSNDSYVFRA